MSTIGSTGLIFVLDSSDTQRIGEASNELMKLLEEPELKDAYVLVFANKQDVLGAHTVNEIKDRMGLTNLTSHNWFIQPSNALKGDGLNTGLDWLATQIHGNSLKGRVMSAVQR